MPEGPKIRRVRRLYGRDRDCQEFAPEFAKVEKDLEGSVKFGAVNIDDKAGMPPPLWIICSARTLQHDDA